MGNRSNGSFVCVPSANISTWQVPSTSGNDSQLAVSPRLGWQSTTPSRINFKNQNLAGVFRLSKSNGRSYKRSPWLWEEKDMAFSRLSLGLALRQEKGPLARLSSLVPYCRCPQSTESGCNGLQLVSFSCARRVHQRKTRFSKTLHRPFEPIREETVQTLCDRVTRSCPVVAW